MINKAITYYTTCTFVVRAKVLVISKETASRIQRAVAFGARGILFICGLLFLACKYSTYPKKLLFI